MKSVTFHPGLALAAVFLSAVSSSQAVLVSNVIEGGGDNEATDTIAAQWTGATWTVSIANEPFLGATIGSNYTVGTFASGAPVFVDRSHRVLDDPGTTISSIAFPSQPVPGYLIGGDYIMSGNDNRDNPAYMLDIFVDDEVRVYMLIDNRLSDADTNTPPTFGAASMQWIVNEGWLPTSNGLNRFRDPLRPDEVPIDEGADNTINQYYSVYYRDVFDPSFRLLQPDNTGRNMYSVVITPIPVPEPGVLGLIGLSACGFLSRRRA